MSGAVQKRILVRGPNWVGDQAMAFPFYQALAKAYPGADCQLVIADAPAGLVPPGIFSSVHHLGERRRSLGSQWRLARWVASQRFDIAYSLPATLSATWPLWAGRVPARVGFSSSGTSLFLTESVRWAGRASGRHKSDLFLDLLRFSTSRSCSDWEKPPEPAHRLRRGIVIAPGAALPLREWPYFPELCGAVVEQWPEEPITLVGAVGDKKWSTRLQRLGLPQITDRIGETTLDDLKAICGQARLVISNDSGAAHVAALAGTPVLVIFGPGDPAYIAPRGRVAIARAERLACSPCESSRCGRPFGYQACLKGLSVEEVLEGARRLIAASSALRDTLSSPVIPV